MIPPPSPAYQQFDRVLDGELSIEGFEQWVYAADSLQQEIGSPAYLALISFDYRQPHADIELAKLLGPQYERARPGMLLRDRAYRYARALADGSVPVRDGVDGLANLWSWDRAAWFQFEDLRTDFESLPAPEEEHLRHPSAVATHRQEWEARRQRLAREARELARDFIRSAYPGWPAVDEPARDMIDAEDAGR